MSRVVHIDKDGERLDCASRWVLKIDDQALTESEIDALGRWLGQDQKNSQVLLEVAAVWDKANVLSWLADLFPGTPKNNTGQKSARNIFNIRLAVFACVTILVLSVPIMLLTLGSEKIDYKQYSAAYETVIGEQKTILLPDGSEVVMNTDSKLSLAYSSSARVLNLGQGEIFVRVAKETRPMSVIAIDQIVQAKGTEFVVQITDDQQVKVMVTEGRVVVGVQRQNADYSENTTLYNRPISPPELKALKDDSNSLSEGESATFGGVDVKKRVIESDDIEVRLSWKKGRLIFRSVPLGEALKEVERYTTFEFVIPDESIKSAVLSGRFRTGDVHTMLALLKTNFDINYEFDGENKVLLSRF